METRIDEHIRNDPELARHVARANVWLTEELSSMAPTAQAEWSIEHDDRGRAVIALKLSDPVAGPKIGRFAPDELDQRYHMGSRFYRLWGDVLEKRAQIHVDALNKSIRGLRAAPDAEDQHRD